MNRKTIRRLVLAAVLALLLGGVVYAVTNGVELRKTNDPETEEQGVEARAELSRVPWSSFTGEIQEAGAQIAAQYESCVPQPDWSSYHQDPGLFLRSFGSLAEAAAYLGLEGFGTPPFPYREAACVVSAHGDESGLVDEVRITAQHITAGEICAQEFITILTDAAAETELVTGSVWTSEFPRDVEFQTYTTPGGLDCAVAVLTPQYDSKYMSLTGRVAVGGIFYELNLSAVPEESAETAMQLLRDWADGLDK